MLLKILADLFIIAGCNGAGKTIRRYYSGLKNFLNLYKDKVDYWILIDNSKTVPTLIAEGWQTKLYQVIDFDKWESINKLVQE